jgi:hypothetical protein
LLRENTVNNVAPAHGIWRAGIACPSIRRKEDTVMRASIVFRVSSCFRGVNMHKVLFLVLVLVLFLYPFALRAQTTNGSITGRVTDPSKATIAEAKVTAVNLGTNFPYDTTNGAGEYTLANLPPGTYRMEVEKSGFKTLIRPEVSLQVQDAQAIDFEMADWRYR